MNDKQILHVAMQNSYNVITHKCTIEEVETEGTPFFIHFPDRDIDKASIKIMTMYFIIEEDYEKCEELKNLYELLFQEEMPQLICECARPKYEMVDDEIMECRCCGRRVI